MSLIKSLITLALIAGAVFFYNSGIMNMNGPGLVNGDNHINRTVLEASQVTKLDGKLSDTSGTVAMTNDDSEIFIAGEKSERYSSDKDIDGLGSLETSVFEKVYMIGTDRVKDLTNFLITKFNGDETIKLASFAGSSMSHVTDVDKDGEHLFIGYSKKISENKTGKKAYTLIYDTEKQEIEKTVELEGLPHAEAVLAGENGFYAASEGKIFRYRIDGVRKWQVQLDYSDLTRGSPHAFLERKDDNIYIATTVSNGHHEIVAAKISSEGEKEWRRKIDIQGLKDKVSAVEVSDDGFLVASNSKYVDSYEPLITYPSDVVLKNFDLSDGSTKWTKVYNNPESSNEKVLKLKDTGEGFKALLKVKKMIDPDARPIESGVEKMNSMVKISNSGNITEVINTQNYSSDRTFMADSAYGLKDNSIHRLDKVNKQVETSQTNYYRKESYKEIASKEEIDWYQKLKDTEMDIEAFDSEGDLHLRITNTGERTISSENLTAHYATPKYSPVEYGVLERGGSDFILGERDNRCLTQGTDLSPGESLSCLTGLKYPEEKRIEVEIMAENIDYQKTLTAP